MISVIIPTLNEEKYIGKCIGGLKSQTFRDFEVIVVDGKSNDKTIDVVKRNSNYKVIASGKRGIGSQQNLGAKHAKGNTLVFTHADTILSRNCLMEINKSMRNKEIVGGSVIGRFEPIDYKVRALNFISPIVQMALKITYAYCIFVRKDIFKKTKGFENCICEDNEFGFRLKKYGKITILTSCSHAASSRRFVHRGFYSTIWLWVSEYFKIKFGYITHIENYPLAR